MKTAKVITKKSKIHGKGIFANKSFKKGKVVLHWDISNLLTKEAFNKLSEKNKYYVNKTNGKLIIMQEPEKYVNHSCSPNTKIKDFCDVAIKNIKKGEEITSNYAKDLPEEISMKCSCKEKNCKKLIKRKLHK